MGYDGDEVDTRTWSPAHRAIQLLTPIFPDPRDSRETIIHQAAAGLIASRCRRAIFEPDRLRRPARQGDNVAIDLDFWREFRDPCNREREVWPTGEFVVRRVDAHRQDTVTTYLRSYGTEFRDDDLVSLLPDHGGGAGVSRIAFDGGARGADPPPAWRSAGGRPPSAWWDALWIDIARQLHRGELAPATQADIERAMHAWIARNGHAAGETAIRERARKLFRALNAEVEN